MRVVNSVNKLFKVLTVASVGVGSALSGHSQTSIRAVRGATDGVFNSVAQAKLYAATGYVDEVCFPRSGKFANAIFGTQHTFKGVQSYFLGASLNKGALNGTFCGFMDMYKNTYSYISAGVSPRVLRRNLVTGKQGLYAEANVSRLSLLGKEKHNSTTKAAGLRYIFDPKGRYSAKAQAKFNKDIIGGKAYYFGGDFVIPFENVKTGVIKENAPKVKLSAGVGVNPTKGKITYGQTLSEPTPCVMNPDILTQDKATVNGSITINF